MVSHCTNHKQFSCSYLHQFNLIASGIINNGPQQFSVNGLQYNKLRKPAIVSTCPFIPVDNNDESSAYSTLLLHTPWSYDGEAQITKYEHNGCRHSREFNSVKPLTRIRRANVSKTSGVRIPYH
jgi:hypothetical protein